ncbi:unnamed protein product, partial [Rotaria sp. Silwood2]
LSDAFVLSLQAAYFHNPTKGNVSDHLQQIQTNDPQQNHQINVTDDYYTVIINANQIFKCPVHK